MLGSGRKPPDFAEKAERRARGAVLYLVLDCGVRGDVVVGVTSWPSPGQEAGQIDDGNRPRRFGCGMSAGAVVYYRPKDRMLSTARGTYTITGLMPTA